MILRYLRVEGLGCFSDAFTAGPFAPGINVVYAPNGTGKTTLFRAVSLAFLEAHRGKSADIQALRPWGRRLTPQVGVEFEHAGRVYRVRKRFLDGASAQVETREGDRWTSFAQGDNADEFLRELLQTESDKPRSSRREYWGLAQVLWTTQGDLSLPPLAASVIESIRDSVGAQLAARDSAIDQRVNEEYLKFFSPTLGKLKSGRNAAPQVRLEAERDRLAGELQTAEELLRQFETESDHIEQVRVTATAAIARYKALAEGLERGRVAVEVYEKLRSEQKELTATRTATQSRHKALRERIDSIECGRQEVIKCETSLAAVNAHLPLLTAELDTRNKAVESAETRLAAQTAAHEQAQAKLRTAQLAEEYVRALTHRKGISERLEGIAAAGAEVQNAEERKAAIQAPTEAEVGELRTMLGKETDALRRLELARVSVVFEPDNGVEVQVITGEQPGAVVCESGQRVVLAGSPNLSFAIRGVGRFEVRGPVADYESVHRDLETHRDWLATFSCHFGSTEPDVLDRRRNEVAQLEAKIQEARRAISTLLARDSAADLQQAHARLSQRIQAIDNEYPHWSAQRPDFAAMIATADAEMTASAKARNEAEVAARAAHTDAGEARAQLTIARGQQITLQDNLARSRRLLAEDQADGVSDDDRRKQLDQAALEYDVCRLALERVETELKQFGEDPGIIAKRLAAEMASADALARTAEEERVRAETRIQALVDRRPYAALTEVSERLGIVREQLVANNEG